VAVVEMRSMKHEATARRGNYGELFATRAPQGLGARHECPHLDGVRRCGSRAGSPDLPRELEERVVDGERTTAPMVNDSRSVPRIEFRVGVQGNSMTGRRRRNRCSPKEDDGVVEFELGLGEGTATFRPAPRSWSIGCARFRYGPRAHQKERKDKREFAGVLETR